MFCFVCTGDGGNDVSMIQAANAGIGIVGKVSMGVVDGILKFPYFCN